MVKPVVNMLASDISHMPLLVVWRDSGVTQRHGFSLRVDIANVRREDQPFVGMSERTPRLLDGTYDFLSGLHIEPYQARAQGDTRFVYLAQAQNDWDDRIVATQEIRSAADLEGKKVIVTSGAPCVFGNLKHSLELAGARLDRVQFVKMERGGWGGPEALARVDRGEARGGHGRCSVRPASGEAGIAPARRSQHPGDP